MDILEHGRTYTIEQCNKCCCKFRYSKKDILTATWSDDYYKYIECPECGHIIKIDEY